MSINEKLASRIKNMPAMPVVCARMLTKLQDPNLELSEIVATIQYDPGITANLLRLANSAYFGMQKPIASLKEACLMAGTKKIMQLALAQGIANVLNQPLAGYGLGPEEFLSHAAWVAIASEEFCATLRIAISDTLFTAGLLHDVGKIALNDMALATKDEIDKAAENNKITRLQAEREVMGVDHTEAGALLLTEWKFPAPLVEAARWHHDPENAPQYAEIVNIVHLANVLSATMGIGTGNAAVSFHPMQRAMEKMKLTPSILEKVACSTLEKMQALEKLLSRQR